MNSPIIAAQKALNQNIAEKPLIDKMEKEFLNINQQVERIAQAVKAGTISIEEKQKADERIEEEIARLQAEQDGLKKRAKENDKSIKENDERLLNIETAIVTITETEDETKALFNNAKSIFNRLAAIEDKHHAEHLALTEKIGNLRQFIVGSSERQQEDNGRNFMYLYILFGLTIVAVGADIVIRLIRG